MRITRFHFAATFIPVGAILTLGCFDPMTTPSLADGSIEITMATVGANIDLDPDGYTLSVDGGSRQPVDANATVKIAALSTGHHLVQLDGVASNCSVAGTNPRSVDVLSDDRATSPVAVLFSVSCVARVANVRVSTTTSGSDPDPDGYVVSVGGVPKGNILTNGVLEISDIRAGQTQVELAGVSGNCTVDGTNPRTLNAAFGTTAEVAFSIRCQPQPSLGPRAFIWSRESGMIALFLPPEANASYANAVNDLGQVAGSVRIGNRYHAVVWTLAGGMVDIGGVTGTVSSYATAINNAGQVAGYSVDASGHARAFRWSPSEGIIVLGLLPGTVSSYARGINISGQVVGESEGTWPNRRPFRWSPDKGMEDLGLFDGDPYGGATAINNNGDIAGYSGDGDYYGTLRAVSWSGNGGKRILDACARGANSFYGCYASANAINSAGLLAGSSEADGPSHPIRWTAAGVAQDLVGLPGSNWSNANGINDNGQIVGTSTGPSFPSGHAFLWSQAEGMVDLGVLNGKASSSAAGVNNSGLVVGSSQ